MKVDLFTSQDFVLIIVYLAAIYAIALKLRANQKEKGLDNQYFIGGLTAKLIGVTAFCFVYGIIYKGGDTVSYFDGALCMANLFSYDFDNFFSILIHSDVSQTKWSAFNAATGYPPWYMRQDANTFSVIRYSTIFCLLGAKSFFVTSLLVASFCYIGIWKVYRLFSSIYPDAKKGLAICILFMPSLIFWGSGIMKDSYVLSAVCWFSYNFYYVFILRKKVVPNAILMFINIGFIISIKPYILLSIVPGALLWLNNAYIKQISSNFIKTIITPTLGIVVIGGGLILYQSAGSLMGDYSNLDKTVEKARVIQEDLLRESQYGSNNYNLGEIDGSIGGMVKMAPIAIFTALYRPMFFEIGSAMMVISALENTALIVLTFILIYKIRLRNMIRILIGEPLIMYSIFFSLLLAFGIGMASTNFGALSRYKIPLMPFYFSAIYLIYSFNTKKDKRTI